MPDETDGHLTGRDVRPVVFTVHGTNDAQPESQGQLWWQAGSNFEAQLARELAQRGVHHVEIIPHHWSGANSDADRLAAARGLAKLIENAARDSRPIALLGHSHGGNIVMEAVTQGRTGRHVSRIATFGSPFFHRKLKAVPWLIAAFQILLGLIITPIMAGYIVLVLQSGSGPRIEAAPLFSAVALVGMASLYAGARKIFRKRLQHWNARRSIKPEHWLAVHSPRDEAMKVLEAAAALKPRYVTVESARRSLDAFAALAGVIGTIAIFGWFGGYFLDPIVSKIESGQYGFATLVDFSFLLLVPVVFAAIAGTIRLVARLGGASTYASVMNLLIHAGVVGAAYGGDDAFHLTGVSRVPPVVPSVRELRIAARDLGGIDDRAIFEAAHKVYDGIIATEEGGIGDPDLMWKRLSDALYHNAYMRDDQVAAAVAEHLASGLQSRVSSG